MTFDDKKKKCPRCGSKLEQYMQEMDSMASEYERMEQDIKNNFKTRELIKKIIIMVTILIAIAIIVGIVLYFRSPQRAVDKEGKELYKKAVEQAKNEQYEEAIKTIKGISVDSSNYEKAKEKKIELLKLQLDKTVNDCMAKGDYDGVITYVNANMADVDDDVDIIQVFGNSIQTYKDAVLQRADEYIDNADYNSAISILTTASRVLKSDSDIDNKLLEVSQREILTKALEYEKAGNYEAAIKYINDNINTVNNNTDILLELTNCEKEFREEILSKAEKAYEADGYSSAVDIVRDALAVLEDDEILLKEKEKYENLAPISLGSLDTFYSDYDGTNGSKRMNQTLEDKLGNTYQNCIEYVYGYKESRDIYTVNGEYSKFTGTIFVPKDRSSVNDDYEYRDPFHFSIYGDDVLLYESPKMTSKQTPVDFEVDITGVEQLSINWQGGAVTWKYELGLADACLYK